MLNFNQLRAFNEAAKFLNFTEAAKNLFVTQPAVTGLIKQFEDYCDLKMFLKKGSKMYLTPEGKIIFGHTSRIFEQERDLENVINELKAGDKAPLQIGVSPSYSWSLFPGLMNLFQRSFPLAKIQLLEGNSLDMIQELLMYKIQLAIVPRIVEDERINYIPAFKEEIILVAPPDHPLIQKAPLSCKDLTGEPFILKEPGSATRKMLQERVGKLFTQLNTIAESNNDKFIKEMVKRKKGIAFLVMSSAKRELDDGELVSIPITPPPLYIEVCLAHLKDVHLSATAKGFIDIVKSILLCNNEPIPIPLDFLSLESCEAT